MPTASARLLCLLILLLPLPAWAEAVQLFSVQAPPLTSSEPGQHGLVGEVVLAALAAEKLDYRLHTPPWPRAQKQVQEGRDLLIMPLSRIPSREKLYTWITPIFHIQRAFFSLGTPVRSMAEARLQLRQVGVGLGSAQHQQLLDAGFREDQLLVLKIDENPALMLEMGRLDAWFNGIPEARYFWEKVGKHELLSSPPLVSNDLYLACSLECDPDLVERLRRRLQLMQASGEVARIQARYARYTD
ncbi:transporter substrate-binding domain-containing protein [Pseudomonas sp. J452]|uniref:substrate-binding periplasmic protein n=1 Tax=Pseudomonas sp. J452 TaxID=2898441 RepID=UPI0021AD7FC5|nr:transporter substrate-binding domain-containing protein [Pseudomonas sp. J452]UUY06653.1 transporter substrate-binding domain-containing protein [Pseudomonas sp. J452]